MKRYLPDGADYEERAIALASQLGIEVPEQPLTNLQWVDLWANIGKALFRPEPPEPRTLQTLWADIGMRLAEEYEPEFRSGPGRPLGSKSKEPRALSENVSPEAKRQRRRRAKIRTAERDPKLGGNKK
jgi:hypothetical protein